MLPKKIEVCMNTCHKIFFKSFMEVINMAFSRIPIYFAVFLLVTSIQDVARMTYTGCKFWNTEPSSQHYIFKPFTPNIRMQILHTVLYTFLKVLTWRICLIINNKELLPLVIISFILMTLMCDSGVILYREIRC